MNKHYIKILKKIRENIISDVFYDLRWHEKETNEQQEMEKVLSMIINRLRGVE